MIVVSSIPIGKSGDFRMERMGDPTPVPGNAPYVFMLYPYPQAEGPPTYATWEPGGDHWTPSKTLGSHQHFQVNAASAKLEPGSYVLEGERSGVVTWLLVSGLV